MCNNTQPYSAHIVLSILRVCWCLILSSSQTSRIGPFDPFRLQSYNCSLQRFFGPPIVLFPCDLYQYDYKGIRFCAQRNPFLFVEVLPDICVGKLIIKSISKLQKNGEDYGMPSLISNELNDEMSHHHKHQGLDLLIRSVSKVTTALSNVSSVFQLFSFLVVCSSMISKGFSFVLRESHSFS